ncbi:MAG: hypothetical protein E7428_06065 [Ruminococcaceae bacterium]|nr:hypothetical protein [Oscillospiraceae bacterium]
MKKYGLIILIVLFLLGMASCKEKETDIEPQPEREPELAVSEENSFEMVETLVNHGRVEDTDPIFESIRDQAEYRKMDSFRLCETADHYKTYQNLVQDVWEGADLAGFPEIPEEWFDTHNLITLFLYDEPGFRYHFDKGIELRKYILDEGGTFRIRLDAKGNEEELNRFPVDRTPKNFASFLIPVDKEDYNETTMNHVEVEVFTAKYRETDETVMELLRAGEKKTLDVEEITNEGGSLEWACHSSLMHLYDHGHWDLFVSGEYQYRYEPGKGIVCSEDFADLPLVVCLELKPMVGLHPEELTEIQNITDYGNFLNKECRKTLLEIGVDEVVAWGSEWDYPELLRNRKGLISIREHTPEAEVTGGSDARTDVSTLAKIRVVTDSRELPTILEDHRVLKAFG